MNISDDLAFNIVMDWKKKNITPSEKSNFIKGLLESTGLSERKLAEKLGIPHSTLNDWVSMRQVGHGHINQNIDVMLERVTFILSKDFVSTNKTKLLINRLRQRIIDIEIEGKI